MTWNHLKQALPEPATIGLFLGIIILITGAFYFVQMLPKEQTYFDLKPKIEGICKAVKSAEKEMCLHVETLEWTMYDRVLVFKNSANAWGILRASIIFVVVLSGVITSIYIANSTGKAQSDTSAILKSAGAAAAFLTPTLLGLYGAFNVSSKPEELRNTALVLADLNNQFLMNRCKPPLENDKPPQPPSTKYCPFTAEEMSLIQNFNRQAYVGSNVLAKVDEGQLTKVSDAAHAHAGKDASR